MGESGCFIRHPRLLLALLLATVGTAYLLNMNMAETWAAVPGGSGVNVKRQVLQQLASATVDGVVLKGASLKLLTLRAPDRNRVDIHVAEADFLESTIDGSERWDPVLLGDAILVNSVDEFHRNNGGMSKSIARGCGLKSMNPDPDRADHADQIGDVTFEACQGPYSSVGIGHVANVALIVWRDDKGRGRCRDVAHVETVGTSDDGYSADPTYASCISGWIGYAMSDLLIRRAEVESPSTVLIPALGTGTGGVPPEATYQAYRRVIEDLLALSEASSSLPDNLVLLLWRGWSPDQWAAHQIAIANLVSELHNRWAMRAVKYRQIAPLATLLGVLSGLIVLALAITIWRGDALGRLRCMAELQLAMTLIGWGLAALGLVAVLQATIGLVLRASWLTNFFLGVGGVVLAIVGERARDAFREASRQGEAQQAAET